MGDVAQKAREGCVKKQKRNEREEKGPRGRVIAVDTAYVNFYDFYALAPAHLEIRFNSLNFKKLPFLSPAPSTDCAVPDPFSLFPSCGSTLYLSFTDLYVSSSSPENEIAPLYTVGDKILDASRHADSPLPSPSLQLPTDNLHPRHPRGC